MARPSHVLVIDSWWALAKVSAVAALILGVSLPAGGPV